MTEQLDARASIDNAIEDRTVCDLLRHNAILHGSQIALSWKDGGTERNLSWLGYRRRVIEAAMGLRELGVGPGDFVAIMALNRPEHAIADLAALHLGAVPVSVYNTLAPEQIAYIAGHCAAKVAIVENAEFLEKWAKIHPELSDLTAMVAIDDSGELPEFDWLTTWAELLATGRLAHEAHPELFEDYWRSVRPEDPATVVYTSGTTGPPKGVVITHRNVLWTLDSIARAAAWDFPLELISYLPLAHVAERMATHYLAMSKVATVHYLPDIKQLGDALTEVRPTAFLGVPRVWEKMRERILDAIDKEPDARKRRIAERALEVGLQIVRYERAGRAAPIRLRLERAVFERIVYSKIRRKVGLDRARYAISSAAPISDDVVEFFFAIGLPLLEIYGMTEASAPITWNRPEGPRIGTVGTALPGVEVRLAGDGEILTRGGNVAPGYYRDPVKTAETIDTDGWLHTGDVGAMDAAGYLRVVDRKKELIVTAGGKNISPANLETMLKAHPLIGHACVVGDRRPYLTALIVIDPEAAASWAEQRDPASRELPQLAADPEFAATIESIVDEVNGRVAHVERIRRFKVLPNAWGPGSEELTPTLKPKRRVIAERYAADIEELYAS